MSGQHQHRGIASPGGRIQSRALSLALEIGIEGTPLGWFSTEDRTAADRGLLAHDRTYLQIRN
jgi:hypothetical protein